MGIEVIFIFLTLPNLENIHVLETRTQKLQMCFIVSHPNKFQKPDVNQGFGLAHESDGTGATKSLQTVAGDKTPVNKPTKHKMSSGAVLLLVSNLRVFDIRQC